MKILIIEDERSLNKTICEFLHKESYTVESAIDYHTAMNKINDYDYDCILLDIMLPGGSGLTILEALRDMRRKDSVIIISAKNSTDDKVAGLDLGADDYLAKPFHLSELNARVKSVLRRKQSDGNLDIKVGNLILDPAKRSVSVEEQEIQLNRKEFDLLYYFVVNPNRLLNKTTLAEFVWGDNIDQADNFDFIYSQIKNLKRKLRSVGATIEIKAVYGFGYKLTIEE